MTVDANSVKGRIVKAAWELFYEKGYDDTTVDDIIKLSETSKGSFYYYFDGKDGLLNTLSTMLDEQYQLLSDKMDTEQNSFDKLLFINYEVHRYMEERISLELLTSLYSTQLTAKGDRSLLDQDREYYRLIMAIVKEGQERGQIKTDKAALEVTKYYSLCERALVSDWCLNKGNYSLAEYSRECMPIMMEHFRGEEGES